MTYFVILATWATWLGASIGIGLLLMTPWRGQSLSRVTVQASLWVGLGALTLLVLLANFALPLGEPSARLLLTIVLAGGWLTLLTLIVKKRLILWCTLWIRVGGLSRAPAFIYIALVVLGLFLIARFAAAEPMDYDTGLYRLGAINYSRDFSLIPGLANVHDRFGFNSATYALAAALELGPWHSQGFRLVTGLFLAALALEVFFRVVIRRPDGPYPGDWYLAISLAFVMAIVLTDSGRWVPSPAQDMIALVPALSSTAFLLDAIASRSRDRPFALLLNLSLVSASISGVMRPLGWLLLAVTGLLGATLVLRSAPNRSISSLFTLAPGLIFGGLATLVMLVRDSVLSGWLLFPLGLFPVPVPWRLTDPKPTGDAITSWGRSPGSPADEVLSDYSWLGPWMQAFISSREAYLVALILVASIAGSLVSRRGRNAWKASWIHLLLSAPPTILYLLAWFVSAPDVRFGWMGLINVCAIPAAWLLYFDAYPPLTARIVGVGVLVLMLLTQILNNRVVPRGADPVPISIDVGVGRWTLLLGPPTTVQTETRALEDGTTVLVPTVGENCWNAFPLCVTGRSSLDFKSRGASIQSGFEPTR